MKREPRGVLLQEDWDFSFLESSRPKHLSTDDPKYRQWLDNVRACMFYEFARESRLISQGSKEYQEKDQAIRKEEEALEKKRPGKIIWRGKKRTMLEILASTSRREMVQWEELASDKAYKRMQDFSQAHVEYEERYEILFQKEQALKKQYAGLFMPLIPPFKRIPITANYRTPWLRLSKARRTRLQKTILCDSPISRGTGFDMAKVVKDYEKQEREWKKYPPKHGGPPGPDFCIKPCATQNGADKFIAVIDWAHYGEKSLIRAFTQLMKSRRQELKISDARGHHERALEHLKALGVMRMLWCYPDHDLIRKQWPDFWHQWIAGNRSKDAVFKTWSELNLNAQSQFRKLFPFEPEDPIRFIKGEKKRYFRYTPLASR